MKICLGYKTKHIAVFLSNVQLSTNLIWLHPRQIADTSRPVMFYPCFHHLARSTYIVSIALLSKMVNCRIDTGQSHHWSDTMVNTEQTERVGFALSIMYSFYHVVHIRIHLLLTQVYRHALLSKHTFNKWKDGKIESFCLKLLKCGYMCSNKVLKKSYWM